MRWLVVVLVGLSLWVVMTWALATLFASCGRAASLELIVPRPKWNQLADSCFTQTDSGMVAFTGAPLTDLAGILFRFRSFSNPADTMTHFVPDVGSESLGMTVTVKDGTTGSARVWSVDTSGNVSCLGLEYVFAFPALAPPQIPPSGTGLRAEFYRYDRWTDFKTFLMERTDSAIAFDWGLGAPCAVCPVDYCSARWTGTLTIPATGLWTLYVDHDDGERLTVDTTMVQSQWFDSRSETASTVFLDAGPHALMVEFYDGYGAAKCWISWSGPGVPKQVIPSWAFGR